MKQSISLPAFRDAFVHAGRSSQFSYEGLEVLFDHIEALEDDMGQEIELDVIALCCDYAEDDAASIANDYGIEIDDWPDDDAVLPSSKTPWRRSSKRCRKRTAS